MKLRLSTGLAAGLLAVALQAPAAAAGTPARVHVRVEGADRTLVPRTTVTTFAGAFSKDGNPAHACAGTSALAALERATGGDWSGTYDPTYSSWLVESVRGERHTAPANANPAPYWSFWLNYQVATVGLCDAELQEGDEVLLFPDCYGTLCPNPSPTPLRLSVPATARPAVPATVRVEEFAVSASWPPVTTAVPAAGATVTAAGRTVTTAADGTAQLTFDAAGPQPVQATKAGRVRSATEAICVTTGTDGLCGTRDTQPPRAGIVGIRDGSHFTRRRAPRVLRGSVTADPSGLRAVKLRLTRQLGRRCWKYSGRRERFLPSRCGKRAWFAIGDRQDWSYLLPARLKRGRYVLDVTALDRARNRDPLDRGRNRVVFHVR